MWLQIQLGHNMSELLNLELPEDLARAVRSLAEATNRPLEAVVLDWISQAVAEPAVETLPDAAVLALCDATLEPAQQEELSDLLERSREGEIAPEDRVRLDQLMLNYRSGLKVKARAWKEAVQRGLRPPCADDAA
jgi:hypothetical protein